MKKPISFAVALTLCVGLTAPALAFSDVPSNHWANSAIQAASEKGIVAGYPDGSFRPTEDVTNVQFCVMLSNAFYAGDLAKQANGSAWYMPAMQTLYDAQILNGAAFAQNGGAFDWDTARANTAKPMNRYDMARMIANIMRQQNRMVTDMEKAAVQTAIGDWGSIPAEYRDAVSACYAAEILGGMPDGTFGGSSVMNRASACVVMNQLSAYLSAAQERSDTTDPQQAADIASGPAVSKPAASTVSKPESNAKPKGNAESESRPTWFSKPDVSQRQEQEPKADPGPKEEPGPVEVEKPSEKPAKTLADGSEITEENVCRLIAAMQEKYDEPMSWTNENTYYSSAMNTRGGGCEAFALICSDAAFGDLGLAEQHSDFDRIRVGDLLCTDGNSHTVIVLEKKEDSVVVAEGNYIDLSKRNTGSIHWGREIPRQELEGDAEFYVRTRYPQ